MSTPDIACTLPVEQVSTRVADWHALVERAVTSEPVPGGTRLRFLPDPTLAAEIGALAAAEQSCCSFFTFVVRIDAAGTELTVTAPAEAGPLVDALFDPHA